MSIAFDKLPDWAQEAIQEAGNTGRIQMNQDGHSFAVAQGLAFYDGQRVTKTGEMPTEDESIKLDDLPSWAKSAIYEAGTNSQVQKSRGTDQLQIIEGYAFFNGKRVV